MAGKRMIHDKICESRKVNSVGMCAEVLWVRIITKADDNGNYWREPFKVHANCMYEKEGVGLEDTISALKELIKVGLLLVYKADGREYVHIADFHSYQELRGDRNAQIDHPLHPVSMGGAYTSEGLRRDVWVDQSEREGKPTGNQPVTARYPKPGHDSNQDADQSEPLKSNSKSKFNSNSNCEQQEPASEEVEPEKFAGGDWSAFCKYFRKQAGGTSDFARFKDNQEKHQELCRSLGSDEVDSVVPVWVELKGGKKQTKKNIFACKNFLEAAAGLIEDKKEEPVAAESSFPVHPIPD